MALMNIERKNVIINDLRTVRLTIVDLSRAAILSAETVNMNTEKEGALLFNTVFNQAERVSELIGRMNQLTRELEALGTDMTECTAENEIVAGCLMELFKLLPSHLADYEDDEDEFIEEFDRLLARDDEVNKRQKLRDTIQTFLKFRRNSNANASSKSSSPSRRPPATSASPSSHSATSAASIPAAAVAAGDAEASSKMSIVTKVVLPIAGGIVGGLVFGPAGLLLGIKGVTMLSACAAVGASVGATAGAGISFAIDSGKKPSPHVDEQPTRSRASSTGNDSLLD